MGPSLISVALAAEPRFRSKVVPSLRSGCMEWTGQKRRHGYGVFRMGSRTDGTRVQLLAHRVAWMIANGKEIPDGLHVCHHCDNPPCVNPAHLFIGTRLDNAIDRTAKGRGVNVVADRKRAQTHCVSGHEFTTANTRIRRNGTRMCIACVRRRKATW